MLSAYSDDKFFWFGPISVNTAVPHPTAGIRAPSGPTANVPIRRLARKACDRRSVRQVRCRADRNAMVSTQKSPRGDVQSAECRGASFSASEKFFFFLPQPVGSSSSRPTTTLFKARRGECLREPSVCAPGLRACAGAFLTRIASHLSVQVVYSVGSRSRGWKRGLGSRKDEKSHVVISTSRRLPV